MATSSRQSTIFGVNDWKTLYQSFSQADFQSYDYETLRKSFVDYLRSQYPETFNDYTESSEYVALLDVVAFMGQSLAFRTDLNTRENFIDTAERRDSVIKLANLVGYNPKRNNSGQGYLKIASIQTTESVSDINGLNLSGLNILWNDPANPNWQEQFNSIINSALIGTQRVGRPGNSQTILGIKTDEYSLHISDTVTPVIPFNASVQGTAMSFELVSVTSLGQEYIYETSPKPNGKFNILYRNDNLGFGSPNSGFFVYFKQGSLRTYDFNLEQKISNQIIDIDIQGINDSDTWLFKVDPVTGQLTEWKQVESVYANLYATYSSEKRTFFSVKSRFNDQVSYTFGDGVFSEIPTGAFRAFVRAGNALSYSIDTSEIRGTRVTLSYISKIGRLETLTLTVELTQQISNAQARETIENIKLRAPTKYYAQNRMVNGEDYNTFPFALYNSIIKSKALNRSSIGTSKNFDLLDPTGKYSSTSSFSQDGALYQVYQNEFSNFDVANGANNIISFLTNTILKILAGVRTLQYYTATQPRYNVIDYYIPLSGSLSGIKGSADLTWTTSSTTELNTGDSLFIDGKIYQITAIVSNTITVFPAYQGESAVDKPVRKSRSVLWKQTSYNGTNITGYFTLNDEPTPLGIYTTNTLKYCTAGALLKFAAPPGYYFGKDGLVAGPPDLAGKKHIWTTVINVVDDGYNGGKGNLYNGLGPVALSKFIPSGAIIETILPAFDNTVPSSLIKSAIARVNINQSFSLVYENSITMNLPRWFIKDYNASNYMVNFESLGDGKYLVTSKSLAYYFGSVRDTRFTYDRSKVIYDPLTGKLLYDVIKVLKANSLPDVHNSFAEDITLSVIGQTIEKDGYPDDYSVEVSSKDPNNTTLIDDPDFFQYITGYKFGSTNNDKFVFTRKIIDVNLLNKFEIIPSTDVVYSYATDSQISIVKYEYPVGQIFYAYGQDKFFTITEDTTSANILLVTELVDYYATTGRQGLYFHYRHNSSNTTRVNPATTNIIDLYLVTTSYYTQYQNWIKDATNTLEEPNVPTIVELKQDYAKVDDYKMLSDTVILNSVKFKPLFGSKASPELRATIKVIKSSNVTASDSEIRIAVINAINTYFDISNWSFGDTFYFSELSAYLHKEVGTLVSSVILVPNNPKSRFGDLYEVRSAPFEIFVSAAQATDIVVISALTADQFK